MFQVDSKITALDPKGRKVHSVYSCINQPVVALRQGEAKPTFAYICSQWTEDESAVEVFILLFQPSTDTANFYVHSDGGVPLEWLEDVEKEALDFTESMGFMMDNLNFGEMPLEKQWEVIAALPPFMADRSQHTGSTDDGEQEKTAAVDPVVDDGPLSDNEILAAQNAEREALGDNAFDEDSLVQLNAEAIVLTNDEHPMHGTLGEDSEARMLELEAEMERPLDDQPEPSEVSINSIDFGADTGAEIDSLLDELSETADLEADKALAALDGPDMGADDSFEQSLPTGLETQTAINELESAVHDTLNSATAVEEQSPGHSEQPSPVRDVTALVDLLGSF